MESEKLFNEKLEEIRNHAVIEVSCWWGHKNAGYKGTIITENRNLYVYQYYYAVSKELEENDVNFILKKQELSIEEYNQVRDFIENEILNQEFRNKIICDAGFDIMVNYNGIKKTIKNNKSFNSDIMLYDKANLLINKLLK